MLPPMRRAGNDFKRVVHFGPMKNGRLFEAVTASAGWPTSLANYTSCGVNRFDCADDAGSTGLIGRRSAASSRSAISERLDFSSCMCFGSGAEGIWNTGSKDGGTGAA